MSRLNFFKGKQILAISFLSSYLLIFSTSYLLSFPWLPEA